MANANNKSGTGKGGKGATPTYVEKKEPKAKVKSSDTGKNGGQTRAPKYSQEGLKGGNKKTKMKTHSGH